MGRTILSLVLLAVISIVFPLNAPVTTENEPTLESFSKTETTFSSHLLSSLFHRIETMMKTLSVVDTSIKQLQEKAHTWAIFQYHIDSWNDQIKTIEHKIDLIRRTQDENQIVNQKLISQEFTLNHILSKVVYLSESCNRGENESSVPLNRDIYFANIKKLINEGDKKIRNEIGTRLSNILRHVQNIERDNRIIGSKSKVNTNEFKMAKLIQPISNCNGSKSSEKIDLKDIERKLNKLNENIQNNSKFVVESDSKQSKKWDETLEYLDKIDDRTFQLFDADTDNSSKLSNLCQSISSEITTFTTSSDLLLKKIEKLLRNVQKKVDKLAERDGCVEKPTFVGYQQNHTSEEEIKTENEFEINGKSKNGIMNFTEDADEIENDGRECSGSQEEIDFVQPSKTGCHQLTKRVNGIYKFSTPKINKSGRDMNEQFCTFTTDGPAWTVFQNRGPYPVQENFNRSWNEYRDGFGSLAKDFWLGNEFVHKLTYIDSCELRIELEDFDDSKAWVEYSTFRIDTETYNYNIIIDGYRGAIPDAMSYHNEHDFSTYDRRNDKSVDACCPCAAGYASGWWFNNCAEANLNGVFRETPLGHNYVGIVWDQWHGDYSLKSAKMMLRPKVWSMESEEGITYNISSEDP